MTGKPTITPLDIEIGKNAKRVRKDRDLSIEAAAEGIGCSPSQLSQMERGKRAWGTEWLQNAANFYKVHVSELTGQGQPDRIDQILLEIDDPQLRDKIKDQVTSYTRGLVDAQK